MFTALKIICSLIILTMLIVTARATCYESMFKIPQAVTSDPWFTATLCDAYFGFLTFYCWVWYKETKTLWRAVWFVLIMGLGNMAMSLYLLIKVFGLPKDATITMLLLRSND